MKDEKTQETTSIETPQSFREVALWLRNISSAVNRLELLQQKQHSENIDKIDDFIGTFATKEELKTLEEKVEKKADNWVETAIKWVLGIIAVVTASIISYIIKQHL